MDRHIALRVIDARAQRTEADDACAIERLAEEARLDADIERLKEKLLSCAVTLNFHPDRLSNNGRLIIRNLLDEGGYRNQYQTGTSNGGRTAYVGGNRDLWEQRLFCGAYHDNDIALTDRPKYGALNIHHYLDGASARFGSCFFVLKPHMTDRCTFAFGDSSTNPEVMGTARHFYGILRALLQEARREGRLLNKEGFDIPGAIEYIDSMGEAGPCVLGRNLDDCIEAHIHGQISLGDDVSGLYMDASFKGGEIGAMAERLCGRYRIALEYIPERRYPIADIDDEWRGPLARPLAERIDARFGDHGGFINPALIGRASRDSVLAPDGWSDIGSEYELFQNFKYLWHFIAYYGKILA